jgi:PAS domain S-box-containing protein
VADPDTEQRFQTLFEQAPFSVQLLSVDGRTLKVNQGWKDLWGAQDGDPLLTYVLSEYNMLEDPQLEAKGITPLLREAFAGGAVRLPAVHYDPAELGKPGRARWVEATARAIRDVQGRVVEVMLIHEDVTERLLAERQLRASEMRLRQLANTIPQMAWIADAQGSLEWYNDRWYEYTGRGQEEMQGGGGRSVMDPQVLAGAEDRWRHSIETGDPFQMTLPIRGRDGNYRPFLTLVAPLRDDAGKVVQWFGTNTDVSSLHEAERVRQEGERRKDEFLAMLAHELRNPLAPISTAAQLLKRPGASPERAARAAEVIERQVRHMTKLVDELIDVSRVTRGLITLHFEPVDLQSVLDAALEQVQPLLLASGHQLARPSGIAQLRVLGDRVRLVQVLVNLLGNAIKYSPPGSSIGLEVEAGGRGDLATVCVHDNGVGIDPAFLPHVFELFSQAKRTSDRTVGGLGVGLALVKSLVEMHGGAVTAESGGLGQGSSFTFTLPLAHTVAAPGTETPGEQEEGAAGAPLRVLLVDDNVDAAETLATLLRLDGHDVRTADNADAALEMAPGFGAEVYILDIGLPGMDGYELAGRLRERAGSAGATFIALTGYGQEGDRERSRSAGFDLHLLKPADHVQLHQALLRSSRK